MKFIAKTIMVGIAVLGLALPAVAQKKPAEEAPPKQAASRNVPQYNMQDEVRLTGKIELIKQYECPISGTLGTHLVFSVDQIKYEVHIAPTKFLEEYGIILKAGDSITLIGAKVKFKGEPALLARGIERENDQFFFRDKQGLPLWR